MRKILFSFMFITLLGVSNLLAQTNISLSQKAEASTIYMKKMLILDNTQVEQVKAFQLSLYQDYEATGIQTGLARNQTEVQQNPSNIAEFKQQKKEGLQKILNSQQFEKYQEQEGRFISIDMKILNKK